MENSKSWLNRQSCQDFYLSEACRARIKPSPRLTLIHMAVLWSALSAYSHSREVILWESTATEQHRSERGGPALLLLCSFHTLLAASSVFHDLCLGSNDDLEHLAFMLASTVALAQSSARCAVWEVQLFVWQTVAGLYIYIYLYVYNLFFLRWNHRMHGVGKDH